LYAVLYYLSAWTTLRELMFAAAKIIIFVVATGSFVAITIWARERQYDESASEWPELAVAGVLVMIPAAALRLNPDFEAAIPLNEAHFVIFGVVLVTAGAASAVINRYDSTEDS